MEAVGGAKFARIHATLKQYGESVAARFEVLPDQTLRQSAAGGHHLMEKGGISMMGADEIKMEADVTQQDLPRRSRIGEEIEGLSVKIGEMVLQYRLIKAFLAFEIVIEEGFINPRFVGDGISAGASQSAFGKDPFGSGQDSAPRRSATFGALGLYWSRGRHRD